MDVFSVKPLESLDVVLQAVDLNMYQVSFNLHDLPPR